MFYAHLVCSMQADCTFNNKGLYRITTVHTSNLQWTQIIQILITATISYNTPTEPNDKPH